MLSVPHRPLSNKGTDPVRTSLSKWLVFSFIVLVPWSSLFMSNINGHDYARILEVIICSICSLAVARGLWRAASCFTGETPAKRKSGWRIWAATLGLFAVASVVQAPVSDRALQELCLLVGLASLAIVVATSGCDASSQFGEHVATAATLIYGCIAMSILVLGLLSGYAPNLEELGMGYINRRFFNHVQTVALPLAALLLHRPGTGSRWRALTWVCLVFGFALLFFSEGRGTFIGIVGALFLSAIWMGHSTWRCIRPLALGLVIGFFVYMTLLVQLPSWLGLPASADLAARVQEGGSISARFELWRLALYFIRESPWFGVGPMHFAHRIHPDAAHPHNIYLQLAAEWGLPVLALLLAGAGVALVQFAKVVRATRDSSERCIGGSLLIACVAILLDGMVSGNFVMPVSQVWIAVCAGMALHWVRRHTSAEGEESTGSTDRSWPGLVCAGLLSVGAVVQLALLFRDAWFLEDVLGRAAALSVNDYLNPRFWSNGWF